MTEKVEKILRLRRSGLSLQEIGDQVGLSKQRIYAICGRGVAMPPVHVTCNGYGQVMVTAALDGAELAERVGRALGRLGDEVEYE